MFWTLKSKKKIPIFLCVFENFKGNFINCPEEKCLKNLLTQSLTWVAKRLPYAPTDHIWVALSPLALPERDWKECFLFPHLHPFLTPLASGAGRFVLLGQG